MDEIVQQVVERTGLPEDKARTAVQVVISQLEARLPPPVATQLRTALTGDALGKGLGEAAKGGIFGR